MSIIFKDVIEYLHRYCFPPPITTWCKAIDKGFFATWTHITSALVRKHLPKPLYTVLGHQHLTQQNVRSTKPKLQANKNLSLIIQPKDFNNKLFTNQTGRFHHHSSKGNQYVMVKYAYKPNAIFAEPLKNQTGTELLEAYEKNMIDWN